MFSKHKFNNKQRELSVINKFWIGFILYTLGYILSVIINLNPFIRVTFQSFGLLIIILNAINLIHFNFDNIYLKITAIIYYLWLSSVVIRGFLLEKEFIKIMIFDPFEGLFVYFVPLIVIFSKNIYYYKKMFETISALCVSFIIFCLFFFTTLINRDISDLSAQAALEYSSKSLSISSGFLLLTYIYHSNKRKFLAFFAIALTLMFSIIKARRGLVFMAGFPLIMLVIFHFLNYRKGYSNRLSLILIIIILFVTTYFYIGTIQPANYGVFSSIVDRTDEDTRSEVVQYFYDDMSTTDWVIGKGINGQYFCPTDEGQMYRNGIESDYLNIILKGGIIRLGLELLILIPAVFKGLFYSKNMLSKASGVWILFYLLCLYPSPNTKFILFYLIVWTSVAICYSKKIRELSDESLIEYFHP